MGSCCKILFVFMFLIAMAIGGKAQQRIIGDSIANQEWKQVNATQYNHLKHKAIVLTSVGGGLFVAGTAMTVTGALLKYDLYYSGSRLATKVALLVFGPMFGVTGLVLSAVGLPKFIRAHRIKKEADSRGVDLSFAPVIVPATNTYGVGISMRF